MSNFMKNLEATVNTTFTENGAVALKSTGNDCLNLFSVMGALRSRPTDVIDKFRAAYAEDAVLATKMWAYARDVRGGLGEREVGRHMLAQLAVLNPNVVINNIELIPFYGRWDDLFVLFNTPCEAAMVAFVKKTLNADWVAMKHEKKATLLAKWMPSVNTSSRESVAMAKKFCVALHSTEKNYRKTLSALRAYLNVVERHMSANEWYAINYATVPSYAMKRYSNAFRNRDSLYFNAYLEDLKAGKTTIKAATLYPYDIVKSILKRSYSEDMTVLEEQWKALPNYVEGENNYVVMADVSGSMMSSDYRPLATSVGLAIYFSERNKGAYANMFMTFTDRPTLVKIDPNQSLAQKVHTVTRHCGYDTNLERAFKAVLDTAVRTNCPKKDMPKAIIVISDMEINSYSIQGGNFTFYDEMKSRFEAAGYEMPSLVFWNVESRHDVMHAMSGDKNVILVSGQATSTFKLLMGSLEMTPYDLMLKALNNERYNLIKF